MFVWLSRFPVGCWPWSPFSTVGRRLAKSSEGQDGSITCTGVLTDAVNRESDVSCASSRCLFHTSTHVAYAYKPSPLYMCGSRWRLTQREQRPRQHRTPKLPRRPNNKLLTSGHCQVLLRAVRIRAAAWLYPAAADRDAAAAAIAAVHVLIQVIDQKWSQAAAARAQLHAAAAAAAPVWPHGGEGPHGSTLGGPLASPWGAMY